MNNTELPAIGIGSEFVGGVNYNGSFNSTEIGDDDFIGITFGYEDSSNFFVLFGAKFNTSNNWWTNQQFKITKVASTTGLNGPAMRQAIASSTSVPGQTEILWKDDENRGWQPNKKYNWKLQHRPASGSLKLELFEESTLLFDTGKLMTNGTTNEGKLGVFTSTQPKTFWYDMFYECDDSEL